MIEEFLALFAVSASICAFVYMEMQVRHFVRLRRDLKLMFERKELTLRPLRKFGLIPSGTGYIRVQPIVRIPSCRNGFGDISSDAPFRSAYDVGESY